MRIVELDDSTDDRGFSFSILEEDLALIGAIRDVHIAEIRHISEYGESGYANLHRMIATSSPLVLWAPSGKLVSSSGCRLTEREFVTLVDRGTVRIIGRKRWLTDRARCGRDCHPVLR